MEEQQVGFLLFKNDIKIFKSLYNKERRKIMSRKVFTLSDITIAQIAKSLQIALLTGTDIVDHLRTLYLEESEEGKLDPTAEYLEVFEGQLASLMSQIEEVPEESASEAPVFTFNQTPEG